MLRNMQILFLLSTLAPTMSIHAVPLTCETQNADSISILPSMAVSNYFIPEYTFRDDQKTILPKLESPRFIQKNRLEGELFFTSRKEKSLELYKANLNLAERDTSALKIATLSPITSETRYLFETIYKKAPSFFVTSKEIYLKNEKSEWEKRDLAALNKSISLSTTLKGADLLTPLENHQFSVLKNVDGKSKLAVFSEKTNSLQAVPQQIQNSSQFHLQSAAGLYVWGEMTSVNYIRTYTYFLANSDLTKVRKILTLSETDNSGAPILVTTSKGEPVVISLKETFKQYKSQVFSFRGVETGALTTLKVDPTSLQTLKENTISYDEETLTRINAIQVSIEHGLTSPVWIQEDDQIIFSAGKIGGTISYSFQLGSWNYHGNYGTALKCEFPERTLR